MTPQKIHYITLKLFSVREVAEQLIWQCLVEDPALFLRTFLEKLTNRDRRVSGTERSKRFCQANWSHVVSACALLMAYCVRQ